MDAFALFSFFCAAAAAADSAAADSAAAFTSASNFSLAFKNKNSAK